jgi:hypothetical protein
MATGLMIKRDDLVRHTSLNGNVDTDRFLQYILIGQETTIQQILGTDLYEKIQTDIENSTLSGDYETLVTTYIKPVLIHAAMVQYLPFAAFTIANNGVYKRSSENSENASKEEIDYLVEKERGIMEFYITRLTEYLTFNAPSKFPEYYTNANEDIRPLNGINFEGWVL